MHGNKIKKLFRLASLDITRCCISRGGKEIEVPESYKNKALKALRSEGASWGGYKTGSGKWVLIEDYKMNDQDYCDPSNPIHY